MRIHGMYKINRRKIEIEDWHDHKAELEEDFFGICGYCGKVFKSTICDSQIDHFIPKNKYPEYENKYSNLVLACKVCNNKKRSDWPSGIAEKSITSDGKKGYVDPCDVEYDKHLTRCDDGSIIGLTDVGKYMAKRMGFDYRPIAETYKINELYIAIQKLRELKDRNSSEYDPDLLSQLFIECEDLRQAIHIRKE